MRRIPAQRQVRCQELFFRREVELRRNQFGYVLGGPVWKNHLFFFSDYQGTREVSGAETVATVPTADQRQGNLEPTLFTTTDSSGNPIPTTVDGTYWAQILSNRLVMR